MGARHGGIGPAIVQKIEDFGNDPVLVRADQLRGARCHPFGPFGRLPHDQHRLSERRRLLLHAAAIGQRNMAHVEQADEMGIIQRIDHGHIAMFRKRSEEHTSELQSLMRISYAVFCLKKKKNTSTTQITNFTNKLILLTTPETQTNNINMKL